MRLRTGLQYMYYLLIRLLYRMIRRQLVVIGLLGSTLDRGRGADRWNTLAADGRPLPPRRPLVDRFELLHGSREQRARRGRRPPTSRTVSPETDGAPARRRLRRPVGLRTGLRALHEFADRLSVRSGARGLSRPRDDRHARRADLPVPADRDAATSRRACCRRRRRSGTRRPKPGSLTIIDLDLSKYDRLAARFQQQQREDLSFLKAGIETRSRRLQRAHRADRAGRDRLARAAAADSGPTGAGKSKLARRIYELKKARQRVTGPFVEVNCATLRGDAAMSTLFGHVRGSFTGAVRDRPGLLRAADGGVLFLDEIGELGPDEQAALLRAIEEKQFLPLGADREVRSDFQLIAGTNADLPARGARAAAFARICWRASTCGRSGCPACASARRTSSPTSITSWPTVSTVTGIARVDEQGSARAVSRVRHVRRSGVAGQLP